MKLTFRLKIFIYFVAIVLVMSIPISLVTYNYMYDLLKMMYIQIQNLRCYL